ncbi:class I SAM-dependent methyltransferase [Actinoallomurus iriomotensis]|uniref:Ubiquinone/menaquinone biosynthesis methyltransferase n=1 Tax=Actinoallomurus iriomotensis TaxID=478107 RepID=A0A9W6S2G2_9ACTN|nr:class I SAM-dependent methyltransferase [Actinoallomurus iriomotensis]GLY85948.1 ubiquinone/menaquinone biosynthesis methyltransferase [Actinoallomurus iriomotensis]
MTPLVRRRVPEAFDRGASAYDRLVGANPGYHADLRRSARAFGFGDRPVRLLDLGCGTGASTAALLAAAPNARVVGVDASAGMLARARAKRWPDGVEFVHARAEELAGAGVTGPFDGVFAAYLIRNLPDPDAVLASLWSLLRPGGRLIVHDYSVRDHPLARLVWHAVCWSVIIPAGRLTTGDAGLYRYLWRSALDFDRPPEFAERLRRAGFTDVRAASMTGWQRGIVHAFGGRRPDPAS